MYESVLEYCLKKDKCTQSIFKGVFARDELPRDLTFPTCFIINTQKRSQEGAHWLAFFYNKNGFCNFFDSYGRSPTHFGLDQYLNETSKGWNWNRKRIQGNSSYCGHYCLLFLYFSCRNQSLKFFTKFSDNVNLNDKLIKSLIDYSSSSCKD